MGADRWGSTKATIQKMGLEPVFEESSDGSRLDVFYVMPDGETYGRRIVSPFDILDATEQDRAIELHRQCVANTHRFVFDRKKVTA